MKLFPAILFSAFALASCKPENTPTQATSGKPKVALVMKSLANEFFQTMAEGAKKHQAAHSNDYELIVNGIN
jgi:ribose transport system substrate-binding protein